MPIFFALTKPVVDEKMRGIDFVLKIAAAKILEIRFLERDAVTGGSANIRSDADVASAGEGGDSAIEGVGGLPGRAAVGNHDSGIGSVALEIVGNPEEGADDFSVEALVMDELRRRQIARAETGDGGIGELTRLDRT